MNIIEDWISERNCRKVNCDLKRNNSFSFESYYLDLGLEIENLLKTEFSNYSKYEFIDSIRGFIIIRR